jgi:hypothetical protein
MVDDAVSMTTAAQKETEAGSLPLLTYSVLEKKIVSLGSENNFALSSARSGAVPSLCTPCYGSVLSPVGAAVQLPRLVGEGGSDPTHFLGGCKPKKWGRSRPFWQFSGRCFWDFAPSIAFSSSGVRCHKVKTWVQDSVQSEKVAFFTARYLAIPWERSPGTAFEDPIGSDDFNRNRASRATALVRQAR